MLKKCTKCKTEKTFDCFTKATSSPDGLFSWCKPCHAAQRKADYQRDKAKNLEKMKARMDKFRRENPEKNAEYAKAARARDPEKARASVQKWYQANREKKLAKEKQNREANLEKYRARAKIYEEANKEKIKERKRLHRKLFPHKTLARCALRRAILLERTPKWLTFRDIKEIEAIYEEAAHMTKVKGEAYHVDHELPLRGKYVSGLHVPSNLRIILGTENQRKSNNWRPE